jgi:hypothetical protein
MTSDSKLVQQMGNKRLTRPIGGQREELIQRRLEAEQEDLRRRQSGCGGCRGRRITR